MKTNSRYYAVSSYLSNKRYEFLNAFSRNKRPANPEAPLSFSGQIKGMFQPLATTVANVPRVLARYKNPGKRLEDMFQGLFGVATLLQAVGIVVVAALQLPVGLARDILQYMWTGFLDSIGRGAKRGDEVSKPLVLFAVGGGSIFRLEINGTGFFAFLWNQAKKLINLLSFVLTRLVERLFLSLTWVITAAFTAVRGALQIALWPVALVLMPIRELRTWNNPPSILENKSVRKDIAANNVESLAARIIKDAAKFQPISLPGEGTELLKAAVTEKLTPVPRAKPISAAPVLLSIPVGDEHSVAPAEQRQARPAASQAPTIAKDAFVDYIRRNPTFFAAPAAKSREAVVPVDAQPLLDHNNQTTGLEAF